MTEAEFNKKYPWVNAYEALALKLKEAYDNLPPKDKNDGDYSKIVAKVKNAFKVAEVDYFRDVWLLKEKARDSLGLKGKKAKELTKEDNARFAEKINELKNEETARLEVAKETGKDIDPFSIFGFFNVDGGPKRLELARALMLEFGVKKSIVDSFNKFAAIPVENYSHRHKNLDMRDQEKCKRLWELFCDILEWNPDPDDDSSITRLAKEIQNIENGFTPKKKNGEVGEKIDKIKGFSGSRIYLFWVQPSKFLPLDGRSVPYLDFKNFPGIDATDLKEHVNTYLKKCAELSKQEVDKRPFASFVDLSQAAYAFSNINGKAERLLKANHNIVLHGAPGTGKTYMAKKIAESMGAVFEQVQFHPSYDYTDFVEGLRPVQEKGAAVAGNVGFELKDGTFKSFCEKALKELNKSPDPDKKSPDPDKAQKYVFIIDEINRGDISKIFGELFFSIDPGYRGIQGAVLTQYSNMVNEPNLFDNTLNEETEKRAAETTDDENEKVEDATKKSKKHGHFFVPENVYIIGTMNDIDRSVESMDFAFRRRFAWLEVLPEDRVEILEEKLGDKAEEAKVRMKNLNKAICDNPNLGRAYQIGPAYFLKVKDYGGKPWNALWEYHLEGLLRDYLRGTESDSKKELEELNALRDAYDSGDLDDDPGED